MAFSRDIAARGFNENTEKMPFRINLQQEVDSFLASIGIPEHQMDSFTSTLRGKLTDRIVALTHQAG